MKIFEQLRYYGPQNIKKRVYLNTDKKGKIHVNKNNENYLRNTQNKKRLKSKLIDMIYIFLGKSPMSHIIIHSFEKRYVSSHIIFLQKDSSTNSLRHW